MVLKLGCYAIMTQNIEWHLNESYWIAGFGSKQLFCVRQSVGGNGLRDERVLIIT